MSAIGRPGKTTTNVESTDAAVGAGRRILLLVLLAGVLVAAAPARAGVVQVTTRADETSPGDGSCSLREAISAVNLPQPGSDCSGVGGGANIIMLGPGIYRLSLPGADEGSNATGDLNIAATKTNLTIQGAGASATTIDATGLGDRVLNIAAAATVAVSGLTISGGHAPPGATGARTVPGSPGEAGGGILNQGSLTLTGVVLTGNEAGAGGSVQLSNSADIGGGRGGDGGGIENLGTLELVGGSVVSNNRAGDAGNVKDGFGSGGAGGDGGGIHNTGKLTLTDSTVSGNVAGSGGSSGPAVNSVGDGGAGGNGGAIYSSAAVTLSDSTINANSAGAGGHGGDSDDGGHSGGPGGNGGGVYSGFPSSLSASNTTLAGNLAGAGGDGGLGSPFDMADGGPGGPAGSGGAIETTIGAFASLTNVTVADNTTASGGAGGRGFHDGAPGNAGGGGGVSDQNSACLGVCTRLQNAIVAHNSGGNCAGPITDGGENLVFGDNSCPGVQVDPRLGPLHDNGGPTETIALHIGSAAVDLAPPGPSCPPTDQRGVARPQGAGCDAGAYELAPPTVSGASASPSGPTTATVRATANANLQDTTVLVRYGTTTAYGPTAVTQDAGAGNAPVPVSVPLSGLTPATTYHALLIATNADGKTSSSDLMFTTSTAKGVGPSGGRGGGRPTSPSLRRVRQSAGRWLEGNARATITARRDRLPVGTTFSFSLNEPAMVSFAFTQSLDGRRIGRRCVAPGIRNLREPRCTRTVIRGTLSLTGRPGTNRVRFTGRLSGNRRLEPGQYTLLVMATNTARQRSVTRRLTFTIVRRRR